MRKLLTTISDGGYSWEELYYDNKQSEFIVEKHHTGSVDDAADYYDGEYGVSPEEALAILEKHGDIHQLIAYAKELNFKDNIRERVLNSINLDKLYTTVYSMAPYMTSKETIYLLLPNKDYMADFGNIAYVSHTNKRIDKKEAIKLFNDNRNRLDCCIYNFRIEQWVKY